MSPSNSRVQWRVWDKKMWFSIFPMNLVTLSAKVSFEMLNPNLLFELSIFISSGISNTNYDPVLMNTVPDVLDKTA